MEEFLLEDVEASMALTLMDMQHASDSIEGVLEGATKC